MKTSPFFSVVIPVYNVEKYLNECVDSVLCQTFRDIEVILVDDGSPDNSGAICDEYALADGRVRVIHKPNGGLSDARNAGIRIARGEYLLFLDSDDYWDDPEALSDLYSDLKANDFSADLLIFQAKLFYPNGQIIPDNWAYPRNFNQLSSMEALQYLVSHGILPGSAWVNAIKHSFLIKYGLFFKTGIKSEDIDWLLRLHNCMPRYQYSDHAFYMYRKGRSSSITGSTDYCYLEQFRQILHTFQHTSYVNPEVEQALKSYVAYQYTILMAKAYLLPTEQRKQILADTIPMKSILKYDMHPKVQKVNQLVQLCGFKNACRILTLYLKIRKR